jgi:hypothetical protein
VGAVHRRYPERDGKSASRLRKGLEGVTGLEKSPKANTPVRGFFRHLGLRLVRRSTLWCPTWLGSFCVALFLAAPAVWWCCYGEAFLSLTERRSPEVLVVEGWIGRDGVRAASKEFAAQGYKYIVTSGGVTSDQRWEEGGWSYAEGAEHELIQLGVPADRIMVATARDTKRQRTFASAVAVREALEAKGIRPATLNVFTWGPHARRSRLVFAKVEPPDINVGVVSWVPPGYGAVPWWRSSDRAKDLLTETAGYVYEAFFNSGRSSNSLDKVTFLDRSQRSPLGNKIAGPSARDDL